MKVVLRPAAEQDVASAALWYEGRRRGLGAEFLDGVAEALERIGEEPEAYPEVLPRLRRILLSRFPYGVFFLVEADRLVVVGCFHVRQSPRRWSDRM